MIIVPHHAAPQGEENGTWLRLRLGRPTASEFHRIINPSAGSGWECIDKDGETCGTRHTKESASLECCRKANKKNPFAEFAPRKAPVELAAAWEEYAAQHIAERVSGGPRDVKPHFNRSMEVGTMREAESRKVFERETGLYVRKASCCITDCGRFLSSGDGLIFPDGDQDAKPIAGLELKNPEPETHLVWLKRGVLPLDKKVQVHGGMAVCELTDWYWMSYCPPYDPLIIRVSADPYTAAVRESLEEFDKGFRAMLATHTENAAIREAVEHFDAEYAGLIAPFKKDR